MISAFARSCRHRGIRLSLLLLTIVGVGLYRWLPQPLAALHPAVEGGGGERYAAMPVAPRGARSPAHPSSSDGSRIEEDGGTLTRRAAGRLESAANAGADHVGSPPYLTLKGSRSDVLQAAKSLAEALPRKVQRRNTTCRNTAQGPILFTDEGGYVCNITTLDGG
eukprot:gene14234-32806_t